jgi:hypothetical protein
MRKAEFAKNSTDSAEESELESNHHQIIEKDSALTTKETLLSYLDV